LTCAGNATFGTNTAKPLKQALQPLPTPSTCKPSASNASCPKIRNVYSYSLHNPLTAYAYATPCSPTTAMPQRARSNNSLPNFIATTTSSLSCRCPASTPTLRNIKSAAAHTRLRSKPYSPKRVLPWFRFSPSPHPSLPTRSPNHERSGNTHFSYPPALA